MRRSLFVVSSVLLTFVSSIGFATPVVSEGQLVIEEAISVAMAEMFRPGPYRADWNKGGVDVKAAIAARPGGVKSNVLLHTQKDGDRTVVSYGVSSVAELMPPNWSKLAEIGNVDALAMAPVAIEPFEGRFMMVIRATEKRSGNAVCDDELIGAQLYDTGTDSSEIPPEVVTAIFKGVIESVRNKTACVRYDVQGDAYRVRYFLENGHSLPAFDKYEETARIVPAAPIAVLLKHKAP
jgi:hypothetical protein